MRRALTDGWSQHFTDFLLRTPICRFALSGRRFDGLSSVAMQTPPSDCPTPPAVVVGPLPPSGSRTMFPNPYSVTPPRSPPRSWPALRQGSGGRPAASPIDTPRPSPARCRVPEPGENLALGKVPVANHPLPSVGQLLVNESRQVLLEPRRDRGLDQPPRAGPHKLRQRVRNPCWRRQRNHRIVAHVRCAPLAETVFPNSISAKTRRTTQLIRTPLSTIAPGGVGGSYLLPAYGDLFLTIHGRYTELRGRGELGGM